MSRPESLGLAERDGGAGLAIDTSWGARQHPRRSQTRTRQGLEVHIVTTPVPLPPAACLVSGASVWGEQMHDTAGLATTYVAAETGSTASELVSRKYGRGTGAACRRQCSILTLTDPATRRRRLFGERTNTGCGCACWTRGYGLDSTRAAGTLNWTRGVPVTERVRWMRIGSGTGIGKSYDRRLSEAPWTGRLIGRGARDEGPACPPCQGPDKGLQCRGDSMSISCTWGAEPNGGSMTEAWPSHGQARGGASPPADKASEPCGRQCLASNHLRARDKSKASVGRPFQSCACIRYRLVRHLTGGALSLRPMTWWHGKFAWANVTRAPGRGEKAYSLRCTPHMAGSIEPEAPGTLLLSRDTPQVCPVANPDGILYDENGHRARASSPVCICNSVARVCQAGHVMQRDKKEESPVPSDEGPWDEPLAFPSLGPLPVRTKMWAASARGCNDAGALRGEQGVLTLARLTGCIRSAA
ncbi:hypothetical protein ACCO45_008213 [Purpureocillium lilacinum]|uniref:Uncharacterized protein n=1 Tax=Purpureocillium lilacinum TaxID=33203 RepID=A0ACC4DQS1_PURLI